MKSTFKSFFSTAKEESEPEFTNEPAQESNFNPLENKEQPFSSIQFDHASTPIIQNENPHIISMEPKKKEDAEFIAQALLNNKAVIVSFHKVTSSEEKTRIVDFVSGVCYSRMYKIEELETSMLIDPRHTTNERLI